METKDNKWLGCVGAAVLIVLGVVLGSIVHGWALSVLWGWFVVPLFQLPSLTIPYAIGIVLVVSMFRSSRKTDKDEDTAEAIAYMIVEAFLSPLLVLAMGWVVLQFVG